MLIHIYSKNTFENRSFVNTLTTATAAPYRLISTSDGLCTPKTKPKIHCITVYTIDLIKSRSFSQNNFYQKLFCVFCLFTNEKEPSFSSRRMSKLGNGVFSIPCY